jgi:predicted transcriptional regulator
MQALIDFDGWRKWEDAAVQNGLKDASNPKKGSVKRTAKAASLEDKSKESSEDTLTAPA